jgi:transcription elongation factor GreA
MTVQCFENYREKREFRDAVMWILKNLKGEPWYVKTGITPQRELITMINILNTSYREIENHRETAENRKTSKLAHTVLFKEDVLGSFVDNADDDTVARIYTLINDVKDLDPADKMALKSRIIKRHPNFKFQGEEEKVTSARGLMVTMAKYGEKQKQLKFLMDVEVPANSKEIAAATLKGDLSENADYSAAKEKQAQLNVTITKLQNEIERAQRFDPAMLNTSRVSFGTKVLLANESSGKDEEYVILGPWESDPENRIISYLSPFGSAMLNKKQGEKFNFTVGDDKVSYTVKSITAAEV